ncbi:hypothetical protein GCM10011490_06750 [Pseudoclavibacter endophyticus]|uniref:Uncharacterized protein n=1 Tax=Pseudoclavibacter endophyticus TaxID=1778590 RepID=A0A6H9WSD7_9MICO|nr:hypothetical protein [Pseudoclavibacter endophyticus]KAB1649837.1 hypothetical protein F8O04_06305 [Pseudoclavibacter endophyticus]GGA59393.1 hypothetical protein GCM10011490_06750 [Pseudoclavibacter endophyticus]
MSNDIVRGNQQAGRDRYRQPRERAQESEALRAGRDLYKKRHGTAPDQQADEPAPTDAQQRGRDLYRRRR